MTNILNFYIGRNILGASLLTLLILTVIRTLFTLIDETGDLGKGNYQLTDAIYYVLLLIPGFLYELFPMAALIGGMAGLGALANHSELTVMRAAGKRTASIAMAVMKYTLVLLVIVFFLGEYVAPQTGRTAAELRGNQLSGGELIRSDSGIWARDGDHMVSIEVIESTTSLIGITRVTLYDGNQVSSLLRAASAKFADGRWTLYDVTQTQVSTKSIASEQFAQQIWDTQLTPQKLDVLKLDPGALNLVALQQYRGYLKDNQLDSGAYDLEFWRKLMMPLSTAVMMLLAISFIFGPMRTVSAGARVMLGVVTGIGFYFVSRAMGPVSLVYGLPPILAALLPPMLFAIVATLLLRRAS